jgi:hypothetical protein
VSNPPSLPFLRVTTKATCLEAQLWAGPDNQPGRRCCWYRCRFAWSSHAKRLIVTYKDMFHQPYEYRL